MARISSGNIAMRILMLAASASLACCSFRPSSSASAALNSAIADASLDISAEKGRFVALGTAVHEARELEQNFLLSKDITYSSQFHATLGKAMATLSDIGQSPVQPGRPACTVAAGVERL